jgi:hypothetical protein
LLAIITVTAWHRPIAVHAQDSGQTLPPKILVLRGVFEVFSLGMNDLTGKLAARGYDVKVTSWSLALSDVQCSDQQRYVIIGHSLGGRMCAWVSRKLKSCGKSVPLLIIVDANLIQPIPANVERCLHLHVTNPYGVFHGSPVRAESPSTEIINWDVSRGQVSHIEGVNHFNIDATPWVHRIIIEVIEKTCPSPLARRRPYATTGESEVALTASSARISLTSSRPRLPADPAESLTSPTTDATLIPEQKWRARRAPEDSVDSSWKPRNIVSQQPVVATRGDQP